MSKAALLPAVAAIVALSVPGMARSGGYAHEQVVDLPLGHDTQRILYEAPPHPRATLVMLPGGTGDVGIERDGEVRHGDNFLVRTRSDWVARGYAVVIPDTIDRTNLRGRRSSTAYGALVDDLARYAGDRGHAPVFLIGTSQGTIAATKAAAQAAPHLIAGLVLTETVSVPGRRSTETVFDAGPQRVRVPVLVLANRDDTCPVAPPGMAPRIAAAMVRSPAVRVLSVEGGRMSDEAACSSRSPHGYDGMEPQVIGAIVAWLRTQGG